MDVKQQFTQTAPTGTQMPPDSYFADIRRRMEQQPSTARQLNVDEERQMQDGFAIDEMTKSAGWAIVADYLATMPKAHVNPVGMTREDWVFAEENAYWHGAVAGEIIALIQQMVQEAHELQRIKLGETPSTQRMRI